MTEGFALHEVILDEAGLPCNYRFLDVNPAFERLTGLQCENVVGKLLYEFLPNEDPLTVKKYAEVAVTGQPVHFENYTPALKRYYEVSAFRPALGQFAVIFMDITERKQTEDALKESEERHRLLSETMLQGVVHQDADGTIIAMNPAAERILGKTREQFLGGTSVREEHHTIREDGSPFPGLEHPSMEALRTGQPVRAVVMGVFNPREGAYRWISIDAMPVLRTGESCPAEVYAIFEDITESRRAESALQTTLQRFYVILSSMYSGILLVTGEGRVEFANQAFCDQFALEDAAADLVGLSAHDLIEMIKDAYLHPDEAVARIREILDRGQAVKGEELAVHGGQTYLRDFVPLNVHGKPYGRLWLHMDITERKRAEEALRESEARLARAQKIAHLGSWEWDMGSGTLTWTDEIYHIFGVSPDEFQPTHEKFLSAIVPEDREIVESTIAHSLPGTPYSVEYRIQTPDGSVRHIFAQGDTDFDAQGKPVRMLGTALDITERKQAEEVLSRNEAKLRAVFRSLVEGVVFLNAKGEVEETNDAVQRLHGHTLEELVDPALDPRARIVRADGSPFPVEEQPAIVALRSGEAVRDVEMGVPISNGTMRWRLVNAQPVQDEQGSLLGVVASFFDITERRRAEESIRQSQKTFSELVERAPFGIYVVDSQFRIAQMNAGSQTGAFRNVRPVIGRDFTEAMHILWPEPVAAGIIAEFRHALETGEPFYSPPFINPCHDVEIVESYEWELHRITLPDGQFGVICYYFDSTKLRQTEAALRESETKLGAAFASMTEAVFIADAEGRLIDFNESFVRYHRFKDREECSRTIADCPRYLDACFQDGTPAPPERWAMARALRGETASDVEYMLRRKDTGETWWGSYNFAPIKDEGGRIVGAVVACREITDRKQAEEVLRASEERFHKVFEHASLGIAIGDLEGKVVEANPTLERLLGYSHGELRGKPFHAFTHPEDARSEFSMLQEVLAGKRDHYEIEKRYIRKDGRTIWVRLSGSLVRGDAGEALHGIALIDDITERKRAEEALRASERRARERAEELASLLDATPTPVFIALDPDCLHLTGNRAADELLRLPLGAEASLSAPPKAKPRHFRAFKDGRELMLDELPAQRAARGEHVRDFEFDLVFDDGTTRHVLGYGTPLTDEEGRPRGAVHVLVDFTERKKAEEALRESEQRLVLAASATGIGIFQSNSVTGEIVGTEQFGYLTGLRETTPTMTTALSQHYHRDQWAERVDPDNWLELRAKIAACQAQRRPLDAEYRIVDVNGAERWVNVRGVFQDDDQGNATSFLGVLMDITERKQAEAHILALNQRLQALMEAVPVGVSYSEDTTCQQITGNPAVLAQFDVTPQDNLSASAPDADAPGRQLTFYRDGRALTDDDLPLQRAVAENRVIPPIELEVVLPNGRRWFADASGAPVRDAQGNVIGGIAVTVDITERKRAEQMLQDMKSAAELYAAELEALMDAVPAAVFVAHDIECREMSGNRMSQAIMRLPAAANFSKSAPPPEQPTKFKAMKDGREIPADQLPVQMAARGQEVRDYEFDLVLEDGTFYTFLGDAVPLLNESGQPCGAIGAFKDITERKRAEEALRVANESLTLAQQAAGAGVWDWDMATGHLEWSPELYRLFGLDPNGERASFDTWRRLLHPEDRVPAEAQIEEAVRNRSPLSNEYRVTLPTGEVRWINALGDTQYDASGEALHMSGICLDVTERKRAEEDLKRLVMDLERSNYDLQQFAYISSHDLQEPLRQVTAFVEMLERHYSSLFDERAKEFMGFITEGTNRMSGLIKDLLAYSRVGRTDKSTQAVDVAAIAREALKNLQLRLEETNAEVTLGDLPVVDGNAVMLGQLFQNLIGNALKFRGEEHPRIHIHCRREEKEWLFRVQDNGIGFAPEYAQRIFEVFKRLHNRERYEGTGIGLSICKRVVELHGGRIWAESEPGNGATFYFTLPA